MTDTALTDSMLTDSMLDQTRQVASWVQGADAALPVPSCPEWKLADLVEHIGSTQQWVATLIENRITDPSAAFGLVGQPVPAQPGEWSSWLQGSADRAATAFAGGTAGADVFDPSGGGDGISFWRRRLFGEISVHRIDTALAVGQPYELDATLAGAAVDDWLDTISSPGWAANVPGFAAAMRGDGQTVAWVAEDIDRAWVLHRSDAPLTLTRTEAGEVGEVGAAVRGNAVDLLQVVSRRRPLAQDDAFRVTGDRGELTHLIDHMDWVGA
ncbi:MAG TPA: maleylpyruvate isomerase family mycothiol-dependent enzyme [Microlunatus sp.]|nr:maleylpyruvate isomerase family mycothiol-dependent enzyme [Microlunatus sp.]